MLTLSIIKADTGGFEYTTMPATAARLAERWEPVAPQVAATAANE